MKKLSILLIFIVLFLVSCSDETDVENGTAQNEETIEKCGDETCDTAEQENPALCPTDCEGEKQESVTPQEAETAEEVVNSQSGRQITSEDTSSYPSLSEEFTFIPDDGVRMTEASNSGVRIDDDGTISLLFQDNTDSGRQHIASSGDGLEFSDRGESVTQSVGGQFRAKQLPDGTWRGYGYDTTIGAEGGCLTSQSSEDGITYTDDEGCRYTVTEDDEGWMGVYDFFADSQDNIVLLYLGDKYGLNNVRRAYSTDGGVAFTFTNDNVLGDEDLGGAGKSYVDEKVLVLPDHRVFLVAMQSGTIYGFISEDDGVSFQRYKEHLLEPDDFVDEEYGTAKGLFDPQIVQLEDGTYRIYVTAKFEGESSSMDDDMEAIVSATTVVE